MKDERIILGVDPGTNITGYALIKIKGRQIELITAGVLQLEKVNHHTLKLKKIFEKILMIIDEYHPDEFAIEAPFFGKNIQSMLKLGRAQGVAMAAALFRQIPVFEYSPRKIKQSVTGRGAASKEQVSALLHQQLKFEIIPKYLDATDALATAVCHYYQNIQPEQPTKYSGWKTFIENNPGKIV